MFNMTARVT